MLDPVAHSLPPAPAPPSSSPTAPSLLHLFSLFPVFWKNLTWANLTPTAGAGETAELCRLVPFWIRVHVVLSRLSILEIVPQVGSQLGSHLLFSSSYQHASYCQLMTLFLVLLIAESVYFFGQYPSPLPSLRVRGWTVLTLSRSQPFSGILGVAGTLFP